MSRNLAWPVVGLLVIASITTAAGEIQSDFRLNRDEYPVVSGSTSTLPLSVLIAGRVTRTSVAWQFESFSGERRLVFTNDEDDASRRVVLDGPVETVKTAPASIEVLKASGIMSLFDRVVHFGTSQSFERLAKKQADLLLTAREP